MSDWIDGFLLYLGLVICVALCAYGWVCIVSAVSP